MTSKTNPKKETNPRSESSKNKNKNFETKKTRLDKERQPNKKKKEKQFLNTVVDDSAAIFSFGEKKTSKLLSPAMNISEPPSLWPKLHRCAAFHLLPLRKIIQRFPPQKPNKNENKNN